MEKLKNFFNRLGVYGFDPVEPLVIAALVSGDPLLLIGKGGTGKTFLLNSISEAMGLAHRHYNASLISFDDLVGFPYPSKDGTGITFLPTPATIWGAESVLVDELSRCKPETQNKFFSVIHERMIQGIQLESLRYRWAAMNPFSLDGDDDDRYEGSRPLDQALADRFAFIIEVPDWPGLSRREQELVIHPAGEGAVSDDGGDLRAFVERVKPGFDRSIAHPPPEIVTYARIASSLMTEAGFRISPRRARLLSRNIIALMSVAAAMGNGLSASERKSLYKLVLRWSLPHRAWKDDVPGHVIDSVHAETIRLAFAGSPGELWASEFLLAPTAGERLRLLFDYDAVRDEKSLAVIQMLAREGRAGAAVFAFCAWPLLIHTDILNEEAMNELSLIAKGVMSIEGELNWRERMSEKNTVHPSWSECMSFLKRLPRKDKHRASRARQLFLYLLVNGEPVVEPAILEQELNSCFMAAKEYASKLTHHAYGRR